MIRNYLKIAWRNMTNNKLYSIIKIGGFAFSVAICILILLYIRHEKSYDRMYPDMDRVFRLVIQAPDGDKSVQYLSFPAPLLRPSRPKYLVLNQSGGCSPTLYLAQGVTSSQ
ncbi:hypothetical protein KUH03_12140 [Sphingobacterium sp. E70]|uniref:ABC transporter permease n=1 Tax=Sphingobacterium sp. E70 TaxID=2853439 RepID=UPI00211C98C0|nr:hypothetical protein [Sphingobacterium sp. E70]ULT27427.1 hypothetical protein KUH03_12140 [Sphingobacterium sp. E70]